MGQLTLALVVAGGFLLGGGTVYALLLAQTATWKSSYHRERQATILWIEQWKDSEHRNRELVDRLHAFKLAGVVGDPKPLSNALLHKVAGANVVRDPTQDSTALEPPDAEPVFFTSSAEGLSTSEEQQ